jgi:hypothetical protein
MQLKEHSLNETEVTYGLISVAEVREYFPPPGANITVYDDEGRKYDTKMHSTAPRIDGLTEWHRTHQTKIGDIAILTINPDNNLGCIGLLPTNYTSIHENKIQDLFKRAGEDHF